jgi:hypothetical protein
VFNTDGEDHARPASRHRAMRASGAHNTMNKFAASWQLAGLSKARLANVQSLLSSAMKLAGINVRR